MATQSPRVSDRPPRGLSKKTSTKHSISLAKTTSPSSFRKIKYIKKSRLEDNHNDSSLKSLHSSETSRTQSTSLTDSGFSLSPFLSPEKGGRSKVQVELLLPSSPDILTVKDVTGGTIQKEVGGETKKKKTKKSKTKVDAPDSEVKKRKTKKKKTKDAVKKKKKDVKKKKMDVKKKKKSHKKEVKKKKRKKSTKDVDTDDPIKNSYEEVAVSLPDLPPFTSDHTTVEKNSSSSSHRSIKKNGSESTHSSSCRDGLGPLVDSSTVSRSRRRRLLALDDTTEHSAADSSFAASYGSMSLAGDTSMSSHDTFRNSPLSMRMKIRIPRTNKPNPRAPPPKPILKPNPNPNPVNWRQLQRNPSTSDRSVTTEGSSYGLSEAISETSKSVSDVWISSSQKSSASHWEEDLKGEPSEFPYPASRLIGNLSTSSSDVSIATFSDASVGDVPVETNNTVEDAMNRKSPLLIAEEMPFRTVFDSNQRQDSIISAPDGDTWVNQPDFSVSSAGDRSNKSNDDDLVGGARSYGSWTSSDGLPEPVEEDQYWAAGQMAIPDLTQWTSSSGGDTTDAPPFEITQDISSTSSRSESLKDESEAKTGSTHNKRVPCSSFDSLVSDSSSVLSHLRKSRTKPKATAPQHPDPSMSLGRLMKSQDGSVGLSDGHHARHFVFNEEESMSVNGQLHTWSQEESAKQDRVRSVELDEDGTSNGSPADEEEFESEETSSCSIPLGIDPFTSEESPSTVSGSESSLEEGLPSDRALRSHEEHEERNSYAKRSLTSLMTSPMFQSLQILCICIFILCDIVLVIALIAVK